MNEADVARMYSEYGYFLFRRCLAYLGDAAAADDAVQEVFVRALQGAKHFRGDAAPRTWLCRIADHLCLDLLRRQRRNPVRGALDVEAESELELPPCAQADDGAALLSARRLLLQLEPEEGRMAMLYYVDELTQEELAQELGLSRRTVGKRLQALLARARTLLGCEEAS
jgi:RNA polymerase sigma-70 factor (ECF subfamily)